MDPKEGRLLVRESVCKVFTTLLTTSSAKKDVNR